MHSKLHFPAFLFLATFNSVLWQRRAENGAHPVSFQWDSDLASSSSGAFLSFQLPLHRQRGSVRAPGHSIMGWMFRGIKPLVEAVDPNLQQCSNLPIQSPRASAEDIDAFQKAYPRLPLTEDSQLPFIDSSTVAQSVDLGSLWLVIDSIVYDCTAFAAEHPAGPEVLDFFRGKDCSWQFWRFHGETHLREYGTPLRIGRTRGVENEFKEPPKYIGLRKLGSADDW